MRPHHILLAFLILTATCRETSPHIGSEVYLIFDITHDVEALVFDDDSLDDWTDIVGDPSLDATDFVADPSAGDGAPYDPTDLDYRIWLGWSDSPPRIFVAMERVDDSFINDYSNDLSEAWRHDSVVRVQIDGDHSGGEYSFTSSNCTGCTEEEIRLRDQSQAQNYQAIITSAGDAQVGYLGAGSDWVNAPPYAAAGGALDPASGRAILEFYLTPFDSLVWSDPIASVPSQLQAGKIIGLDIAVSDFDTEPGAYHAYHTLTGPAHTWRYAERMADARLVGNGTICVTEVDTWGRIKASFVDLLD
ncbi:MAG: hypothetical protein HOH74_25025 [Gemmatimonadetes bacterium]|nr:hypothetical protein [Gemmatimonadota bacterium]